MTNHSKSRPPEAVLICIYFFLAAFLQVYAYHKGMEILNYGAPSIRNFVIYCGFSPLAGYLMWTGRRRARFAAYVFLTMEIVRSIRWGHPLPLLIAVIFILTLQTGRMREAYPSMLKRWGLKR
jgi:hypothetical protein